MKSYFTGLLLVVLIVVLQFPFCTNRHTSFPDKNIEEGYQLAKIHCATCHLFPEPSSLNKNTWSKFVLPKMAPNVGVGYFMEGYMQLDIDTSLLTLNQWYNIVRYYLSQSPDSLEQEEEKPAVQKQTALFTVTGIYTGITTPSTTLVEIDTGNKRILFGDGLLEKVFALSSSLLVNDSVKTGVGPSDIMMTDTGLYILTMGVLYPSDARAGRLYYADTGFNKVAILLDSLQRPVHATYTDLNNDRLEDIILCEFGNKFGALSWFENKGKAIYQKHILRPLPGAIKTMVLDFNADGKKDIIALMAQGDEGLFIYYNEGNGVFREERIMRFPPSYGSNHFHLADFNEDGFIDIVTTNGDNGDYPPVLKPYHGIRIFLNDGKNVFTEKIFLPVNGVSKVIALDFDADGDIDLASIAYFPDFIHLPEEAFLYWENKGNLNFVPSTIDKVADGRWLTMDAGDMDGDGDPDIILGNADFRLGDIPPALKSRWEKSSPSVLILKNNLH